MKFSTAYTLKEHKFELEILSKKGASITVNIRVSKNGYACIMVEPTTTNYIDVVLLRSISIRDLVECIVDSDAFIKHDVEKFQRDNLQNNCYNFDDIRVRSFIDKHGHIVWITSIDNYFADFDAISSNSVSDYIYTNKEMHGNEIKFQPRMKVRMRYLNMIVLLAAVYFGSYNNTPIDTDDDIEDHDDNLRAYTKTPYTEESMAKVNTMAGHNLDNED